MTDEHDLERRARRPVDPSERADLLAELAASKPLVPAASDDLVQRLTRAIFALKSPPPDGSQHYRSGWDDGLEAAMDAVRRELEGETAT